MQEIKKLLSIQRGFTLIELLVVIGILVVLLGASLVAINPFRQFAQANDANRWSGVSTIMNAIYQNVVDNRGTFNCTPSIPTVATEMGSGAGQYDICSCIVPSYLGAMPYDPQSGSYTDCSTYDTGYNILRDTVGGRITISAPTAQLGTVQVTR